MLDSTFTIYKSGDAYRWASVSNVAIKDREWEIVSEQAYDDAIAHAKSTGDFGELDLVHVNGTDIGDCDFMIRADNRLIEGGSFYDTDLAQRAMSAVQRDPPYWGVSIKFVYDPSKFDGTKYHGNIRIRKRTILPQEMAASFGTKFYAMTGGNSMSKEMNDKTRDALEKLDLSEDEIVTLAEKQVDEEPNTVEKEEEVVAEATPEVVEVKKSTWERLSEVIKTLVSSNEPETETDSQKETEVDPVEAQEEKGISKEMLQAIAEAISTPLVEKMAEMQDSYTEKIAHLEARLSEAEKVVEDKVISKLVELPQIVKVRASEVDATVETQPLPQGMVLPQSTLASQGYVSELMKGVQDAVALGVSGALDKVQI